VGPDPPSLNVFFQMRSLTGTELVGQDPPYTFDARTENISGSVPGTLLMPTQMKSFMWLELVGQDPPYAFDARTENISGSVPGPSSYRQRPSSPWTRKGRAW
jgi:hypothetical protein